MMPAYVYWQCLVNIGYCDTSDASYNKRAQGLMGVVPRRFPTHSSTDKGALMTNPSPGMITFLCIDVQARTQEFVASDAESSLDHYTTILYQAIHACGGTVFKYGDGSVYTAFPTAQAALAAAPASY